MFHFFPEQGTEVGEESGETWQKPGHWVPLLDLDWTPLSAIYSDPKGGCEPSTQCLSPGPQSTCSGGGGGGGGTPAFLPLLLPTGEWLVVLALPLVLQ